MKKLIYIFSITCLAYFQVQAADFIRIDEKNRPGDDKKSKAKREDTTKLEITRNEFIEETEVSEEEADTMEISFPSHDLYASWDTNKAHPYNFNETFKEDSVTIVLTQGEDNCFSMPVKGRLTSVFGWRKYRPHYGTDIDLEKGDSIVCAFDGMVRIARYFQGYGNCVIVRHNNGLETVYGHMSKIMVESGQKVYASTLLGLGGNTGRSRGSHLHFEIRYLGQALDTQDFIDFEKNNLKSNEFVLRKKDVENKYDLRALHARHKSDLMARYGKVSADGYYRVRKGDTLGAIARKTGTSVKSLCRKNKIKATSILRLGQKLKI